MVVPRGPHQRRMCSGLLCASKTKRRGALNLRVNSISTSDLSVSVIAPTCREICELLIVITALLLLLKFGQVGVELVEALVPDAPVALDPVGDVLEGRRLEAARAPLGLSALSDKSCSLKDFEVLRYGWELEVERFGEFVHGGLAVCGPRQDPPARRG